MGKFVEILGNLLLQLGWPGFIAFLLLGISSYASIQWIKQIQFRKIVGRSGIKVGDKSDLKYHILFSSAQYNLAIELPNLDIFPDKPVRQQLMVDLLRIYIKAIYDGCKDISTTNMKGWSSEQWTIEMCNRMSAMVATAKNGAYAEGIPDVVIVKFSRWMNPSLDMLFTYVEMIGSSNLYITNIARTNTMFLVVNLLMSTILGDAEKSIKALNGDITGKLYKGQVIEPIDH